MNPNGRNGNPMQLLQKVLSDTGLPAPDRRPLHDYSCSPETFAELEKALCSRIVAGRGIETAAAGFVFWAAEHIRARFSGGPLTWVFVLNGLGLPDNQQLGKELVERGLGWWGREIRVLAAGTRRMFLYSLMAEGGIPEALLKEPGLYRDVVLGLLREIESEGGTAAELWSERIAARWIVRLPQTFQSSDVARLLAGLALSLADLRAELPADLPEAAAEHWLNTHRPGWTSDIPLRMTPEIAETLIRPALRAEREPLSALPGPLCRRELRRDETGTWHGYLALSDDGWLPAALFPGAVDLRLRLLPAGTRPIDGLTYSAAPEDNGWRLRRFGSTGGVPFQFHPQEPFALAAFADGRVKGEAVIDPGLPAPDESPHFWRVADLGEGASAHRLIPLSGTGRTRAACVWVLAPEDMDPETDAGLMLEDLDAAPGGLLWRISGKGILSLGTRGYRVETGAEDESTEARLIASGETLPGWRLEGSTPVYHGDVTFYGQVGASAPRRVPEVELRRAPARSLGGEIVEWAQEDETLASFRLVRLPRSTRFELREDAPGRVTLTAEGLQSGWRVKLGAGEAETGGEVEDGAARLTLETPGMAPGLVRLRLSEPETGAALMLQAAWPARMGMIFDPQGVRLIQNQPISIEALHGWRVVVPEGLRGELQLWLRGQRAISLPVAGECSLTAHRPLIQAMLVQDGPDAQVNLSLVVGGDEGKRLEIRRYHEQAVVEGGYLRVGVARDQPISPETSLAIQLRKSQRLTIHTVDIGRPECSKLIEQPASLELRTFLGDAGGPWLMQPRLEGQVQRAVVWTAHPTVQTSRDDRIEIYTQEWRRLISTPEDSEWDRLWRLIAAAGQGGDAGMLDEVQALAQVPTAAICLALRVHSRDLSEVLALDSATPIFWPTVPVADFTEAIQADHRRRLAKLSSLFDAQDAEEEANRALVKRFRQILTMMPELAGHFGGALTTTELFQRMIHLPDLLEMLKPLLLSNPGARLTDSAQDAARRFDRLPAGVLGLEPLHRPEGIDFNPYAQSVIDAPLVAAEMAAGQRATPSVAEKLILINLRLVDPIYFDAALPAALHLLFTTESSV